MYSYYVHINTPSILIENEHFSWSESLGRGLEVQAAIKLHFALALAPPPDQPKITAFKKTPNTNFVTH